MLAPGVCMNIISARHMKGGYGTVSNPEKFLNQDFQQLKEYCLIRRVRYIDDMFPPDHRSIGREVLEDSDMDQVKWLRPSQIVPNPSFVVDGLSRFDFGQGSVENCWFLASIGALTFQDFILRQVVPLEQTFEEDYCGLFHFRFWRYGKWVDVVIDDKLPTINGKLIFVKSMDPSEFWPALLEKAYAKVCGSYSDMNAGTPTEALVDFTGGVHISVELSDPPPNLWELMCKAGRSKALMGCGTHQGETPANNVLPNGLVQGHAYTVTGVRQVWNEGKVVRLVRLWNPWCHGEWNGDWSDRSPLWQTVIPQDRETCLTVREDGEFWMTIEDFCKFYVDLDICCLCPDFLPGATPVPGRPCAMRADGLQGFLQEAAYITPEPFWSNPQYRVEIGGMPDECAQNPDEKNMLVSLMQKPDKRNRRLVQNLHIGFYVFEVTEEYKAVKGMFPASFFSRSKPVAQSTRFMDTREVMELMMLKPGEYLIVPSTYDPNETASFILTVLSKVETYMHENSGYHHEQMKTEKTTPQSKTADEENKRTLFRQYSDKYEEVDAEQLQSLLNDKILKGNLKSGGFSTDACRSMVALMDTSVTGKLNSEEFVSLWKKIVTFKNIFSQCDAAQTGTLSLIELRNAIMAAGMTISDGMLNIMALRYGASSGCITLENFISLVLRFDRMSQIFKQLSNGPALTLEEPEWMYLVMYT